MNEASALSRFRTTSSTTSRHQRKEDPMRRRLTAAFVLASLASGGAAILSSAEVANVQIVQVCKRQVLGDLGEFVCVEWSTCGTTTRASGRATMASTAARPQTDARDSLSTTGWRTRRRRHRPRGTPTCGISEPATSDSLASRRQEHARQRAIRQELLAAKRGGADPSHLGGRRCCFCTLTVMS